MLITMGADMSDKELARVGQIVSTCHSDSLAGANEQFHIHLTAAIPSSRRRAILRKRLMPGWAGPM
jgi:hypothetical protein